MKVWVSRRREEGAALASALPVVDGASLLELVVVEVTLDGNRRPAKVARLRPIGEQRILAQMLLPKLVKVHGWNLVLSGVEEVRMEYGKPRGFAQTWVCKLWVPEQAAGFRVRHTYERGAAIPKSAIHQASGTRGTLVVTTDYVTPLQRHTLCAEMHHYKTATFPAGRLVDCHIEWMSDNTFELGGLQVWDAHGDRSQWVERAGWLCEFDVEQRELTKAEYRMLR
ncbi:hypothetical protein GJ698_22090 [Pseudoduganella sp. FT26W]|uniref:Uncharacterized protein n=1 Tax=Duganella aquatilis TaxID=2666082 RepID=A0A844D9G8_9BURK|nr:hypothetical protein [Duganella aquatilis]MRW86765.1 hypothetical protein [Duganella aquatilis]